MDAAIEWLAQLGIASQKRLQKHRDNIRFLADATVRNELEQLRSELGLERAREIFWSWVESFEFLKLFKCRQNLDEQDLVRALKRAVEGPTDVFAESANSSTSAGRNYMFELVVAAILACAGLRPRIGKPDVTADFEGYRLLIECKRPFSYRGIHENVISAGSQLRKRLKTVPDPAIGLIALSVSKILNAGDKIFEVDRRANLAEALGAEIEAVWQGNKRSFLDLSEPRVMGALVHLSTPTAIKSEHVVLAAGMTHVYSFRGTHKEQTVLEDLEEKMRNRDEQGQ